MENRGHGIAQGTPGSEAHYVVLQAEEMERLLKCSLKSSTTLDLLVVKEGIITFPSTFEASSPFWGSRRGRLAILGDAKFPMSQGRTANLGLQSTALACQ